MDAMLIHLRVTSMKFASTHVYTKVESGSVSNLSCPGTQRYYPGQGSNPDCSIPSSARKPLGHRASRGIHPQYIRTNHL